MTAQRVGAFVCAGVVAWLIAPRVQSQAQPFVPGCTVPFQTDTHDIDSKCGRQGDPAGGPEGKLQNGSKPTTAPAGRRLK
jgi:hypothetical protein